MKHLYGGMTFPELLNAVSQQTKSLVEVKRVFSKIPVGSLIRVHMLEVTHDAPEGASLHVYKDYYKGVLDMYTPDMLKILVRAEEEIEPTLVRIEIDEVIDAPEVLKSFTEATDASGLGKWTLDVNTILANAPAISDYVQDVVEHLDSTSSVYYVIEVI